MKDTLVLGVVFPSCSKYLDDYFKSLLNQTDSDFDILIIEDGLPLPNKYKKRNVFSLAFEGYKSPAAIREFGIKYAVKMEYKYLIFTDTDDYFSLKRVENTKKKLSSTNVIYINNITIIADNKKIIKNKILDENIIKSAIKLDNILSYNTFGLSHTAINLSALPIDFYIPSEIIAVDWWIFTVLVFNKVKYEFDEDIITYYRQHTSNLAGYTEFVNSDKIYRGIKIKENHYKQLIEYCQKANEHFLVEKIVDKYNLITELKSKIKDDIFFKHYIDVINKNIFEIKKGWWSEVLPINEWRKYE